MLGYSFDGKQNSVPALAVLLALAACATTAEIESEPLEAGVRRTFSGEFDEVVLAAVEAIRQNDLELEGYGEVDAGTWMITAMTGTSARGWGSIVRIVIQRQSEDETFVRVLTRRRVARNVTAEDDYSAAIFSRMEILLAKQ